MTKETGKFRNIVICGDVGTGTTTLSKSLAEKLGWNHISIGEFFRDYHQKHNIPLWDKSKIPDEVEKNSDLEMFEKLKSDKNIVFDAHYAGWFAKNLPDVLRILLLCDKKVATQRILARTHTHQESPAEIEKRRKQLRDKFKKLYSDDNYEDPGFFHLVIDTTRSNVDETFAKAYSAFKS